MVVTASFAWCGQYNTNKSTDKKLWCSLTQWTIMTGLPLVAGQSHGRNDKVWCWMLLPVPYQANKLVWMTFILWKEWVECWETRMSNPVNNPSACSNVALTHVKLMSLPPSRSSHLQPHGAGLITAIKCKYRKHLPDHVLSRMGQYCSSQNFEACLNLANPHMDSTWANTYPKMFCQMWVFHCTAHTRWWASRWNWRWTAPLCNIRVIFHGKTS